MHLNTHFNAQQILWTLTFAAQLVLLVVLLGKDRARRFPIFTAAMTLMALRLLAIKLLVGRLAPIPLTTIFIIVANLTAILAVLVLVEMARRSFAGLHRTQWILNVAGMLVVAGGVVAVWGPWPAWKTLTADSQLATLRLMQLVAQKADLLANVLTVELGVAILLFGRRFKTGLRSHVQQIVIGLSTLAMAQLVAQGAWLSILRSAAPHSQADVQRIVGLQEKLFNAAGAVLVVVLLSTVKSVRTRVSPDRGIELLRERRRPAPSDA